MPLRIYKYSQSEDYLDCWCRQKNLYDCFFGSNLDGFEGEENPGYFKSDSECSR